MFRGLLQSIFIIAEVGNLIRNNISDGYYNQSCWIDGWMFLIFVRIYRISLFSQSVHLESQVTSCGEPPISNSKIEGRQNSQCFQIKSFFCGKVLSSVVSSQNYSVEFTESFQDALQKLNYRYSFPLCIVYRLLDPYRSSGRSYRHHLITQFNNPGENDTANGISGMLQCVKVDKNSLEKKNRTARPSPAQKSTKCVQKWPT